jgi:hypothetical protein
LLIDTVVCLTLGKWETVSGRFGGYFREQLWAKLPWVEAVNWPSAHAASLLARCSLPSS